MTRHVLMRIQNFPDLVKSAAWLGQLCLVLRQDKEGSSPASVLSLGHMTVLVCQIHNSVWSVWNGKYTLPLLQAEYPKTNTATWSGKVSMLPGEKKSCFDFLHQTTNLRASTRLNSNQI